MSNFSDSNWVTAAGFLATLDRDMKGIHGATASDAAWGDEFTHISLLVKSRLGSFINCTKQPVEKWPRALCCFYALAYIQIRKVERTEAAQKEIFASVAELGKEQLDMGRDLTTSIYSVVRYYGQTAADVFAGVAEL